MSNKDRRYLEYIDESIALINVYIHEGPDDPFSPAATPSARQDAIISRMEHLADAATNLSTELRGRHPEIPWDRIRGLRNVYAHGYIDVDPEEAKKTVENHLPDLQKAVREELGKLPDGPGAMRATVIDLAADPDHLRERLRKLAERVKAPVTPPKTSPPATPKTSPPPPHVATDHHRVPPPGQEAARRRGPRPAG